MRSEQLCELRDSINGQILSDVVKEKRKLSVVFETYEHKMMTGHSSEYIKVSAPSDENIHGMIKTVVPTATKDKQIIGKIID